MKQTNHFVFLSVAAVFATSLLFVGCGSDVTGTYTGTQTISQSLGGSKQENVTLQMTESGGKTTATIISSSGSTGQLNGDDNGDTISNVSMTYTPSNNFSQGVNNNFFIGSATVSGNLIRNGNSISGVLTGTSSNSFNNQQQVPGNNINNNNAVTITFQVEKSGE